MTLLSVCYSLYESACFISYLLISLNIFKSTLNSTTYASKKKEFFFLLEIIFTPFGKRILSWLFIYVWKKAMLFYFKVYIILTYLSSENSATLNLS